MIKGKELSTLKKEGTYPSHEHGYPVFYLDSKDQVLCAKCASLPKEERSNTFGHIVEADINWEDPSLHCAECEAEIESAYGDE